MNIALLTDGVTPYVLGGMQRHSAMLAKHLSLFGNLKIILFHTAFSPDKIGDAINLKGFGDADCLNLDHVFISYPKRGQYPGHYIRDSRVYSEKLLRAYQAYSANIDFIYAQGLTGWAFIEAKHRGESLPLVGVNCHGYEMFQKAASFRNKLEHLLLRRAFSKLTQNADYVFSFSGKIREIAEDRLGVRAERILEIPNGIDQSWVVQAPCPPGQPIRFIFLGRYERRKGIEELHAVLDNWNGHGIEFIFIGPIPKEKQLNLPWVHYRGAISDSEQIKSELDSADVLVCPSYSEGMPTVILEAMARGLAIVATDVGAVSEIVDSENGILLDRVSVPKLKHALVKMSQISDAELNRMKSASLKRVAGYTWPVVSAQIVKEVKRVVSVS